MGVHNILIADKVTSIEVYSKIVGSVEGSTPEESEALNQLTTNLFGAVFNQVPGELKLGSGKVFETEDYKVIPYSEGEKVNGYIIADHSDSNELLTEAISTLVDVFESEFSDKFSNWSGEVSEDLFPFEKLMQDKVRMAVFQELQSKAVGWRKKLKPFIEPYHHLQDVVKQKLNDLRPVFDPRLKLNNKTREGVIYDSIKLTIPQPVKEYWRKPFHKLEVEINGELNNPEEVVPDLPDLSFEGSIEDEQTPPDDERLLNPFLMYSYGIQGEGRVRIKPLRYKEVPLKKVYEHFSGLFEDLEEKVPDSEKLLFEVHDIALDSLSRLYDYYASSSRASHAVKKASENLVKSAEGLSVDSILDIVDAGLERREVDLLLKLRAQDDGEYVPVLSNPHILDYMREAAGEKATQIKYGIDREVIRLAYNTLSYLHEGVNDSGLKKMLEDSDEFSSLRKSVNKLYKKVHKSGIDEILEKKKLSKSELKEVYGYLREMISPDEEEYGIFDKTKLFIKNKKAELSDYRVSLAPEAFSRTPSGVENIVKTVQNFLDCYNILSI